MANTKISALTTASALVGTDLLPIVQDVATTPVTRKVALDDLFDFWSFIDGWVDPNETWTYASATTFTISGDKTAIYTKGLKLKMTNTTVKYFYVVSSSYSAPNTTVTITGGTSYTLANAAISANYYSRADKPQGFPTYFSYTPTYTGTGFAIGNATVVAAFTISNGGWVDYIFDLTYGSTTDFGTTQIGISLPVSVAAAPAATYFGVAHLRDSGTNNYDRSTQIAASLSATEIKFFNQLDSPTNVSTVYKTVPFTWGTADTLQFQTRYLMA